LWLCCVRTFLKRAGTFILVLGSTKIAQFCQPFSAFTLIVLKMEKPKFSHFRYLTGAASTAFSCRGYYQDFLRQGKGTEFSELLEEK